MLKNNEIIETLNDYTLLTMPIRIEDHLRLYVIFDNIDRLDSYMKVGKYLGLNKYICTVSDNEKEKSNIMLVSDEDGIIVEKINF